MNIVIKRAIIGIESVVNINSEQALRRLQSTRNLANLVPALVPDKLVVPESRAIPTVTPQRPQPMVQTPPEATSGESTVRHETINRSVRANRPNISEVMRNVMGELAERGAKCSNVARAFGVSGSAAEQAKNGRVGGLPPTAERLQVIAQRKLDIKDTALLKLMMALNLIDEDKLVDASAKDLSAIASNMGKVAMSLAENQGQGNQVNITVYAPTMREEGRFKTIDV